MTPTAPMQVPDQEILENSIDSDDSSADEDYNNELPFESEYYRTSTDRDEFVKPLPGPEENEIDDGEGGIDLDESFSWNEQTPDCTFHIFIQKFYESIDRLEIKLEGLKLKSTAKSNLTLDEFVNDAQAKLLENFKGKNLTDGLVNDVISYLRDTFSSTYGYGDYCGVSTNVITFFMRNETENDSYEESEGVTEEPIEVDSSTQIEAEKEIGNDSDSDTDIETATATDTEPDTSTDTSTDTTTDTAIDTATDTATDSATETATETEYATEYSNEYSTEFSHVSSDFVNVEVTDGDIVDVVDVTTESHHSQVLKRPKLAAIIQESISFYKALHNWKFPPPSEF